MTVEVADCSFVSETCDETGNACTPDFTGVINVNVVLSRPATVWTSSSQSNYVTADSRSASTCQPRQGEDYAEVSASMNGAMIDGSTTQGLRQDCRSLNKAR